MNQEKISRAIELQNRANKEAEVYEKTTVNTIDNLMDILDSLTREEKNEFIRQCIFS